MLSTCCRRTCLNSIGSYCGTTTLLLVRGKHSRPAHSKGSNPPQRKPIAITSTDLIKQLRFETGAPILECRKALAQTDNDLKEAQIWLRQHGMAKVAQQNRTATDGVVALRISADHKSAALIKVAAETDFSAKSGRFVTLVSQTAQAVMAYRPTEVAAAVAPSSSDSSSSSPSDSDVLPPASIEFSNELLQQCRYGDDETTTTVEQLVQDAVVAIRENISITSAERWQITPSNRDAFLVGYAHNRVDKGVDGEEGFDPCLVAGTVAAIVELERIDPNLPEVNLLAIGKKLAMHMYLHPNEVPLIDIERERDLLTAQVVKKISKDPDGETVRKIVAGLLRKYYSNVCLSEMAHSIEETIPHIGVGMKALGVEIKRYKRLEIAPTIATTPTTTAATAAEIAAATTAATTTSTTSESDDEIDDEIDDDSEDDSDYDSDDGSDAGSDDDDDDDNDKK
jgi:translation elongation factor EF-Ts